MKADSLLFEIKALEQEIFRYIMGHIKMSEGKKIPTPTQMQIVAYILKHANTDIYQRDLENVLQLRRATVSGVLQTMEKNHLIERLVDENDTRSKKIILNPNVISSFEGHFAKIKQMEQIMVEGLTNEEIEVFRKVIGQMKENIEYNNN